MVKKQGEYMHAGIIVYSVTGFTKTFAEIIKSVIEKSGHTADIINLETDIRITGGTAASCPEFKFINLPDCTDYDIILIGGPVWAFSANPVIIKCIEQINDVSGKSMMPFVTMAFPFAFMGGLNALRMMRNIAEKRDMHVMEGVVLCRMGRNFNNEAQKKAFMIAERLQHTQI